MSCSFTLAHYADILETLKAEGYTAVSFRECQAAPGQVVIRHDVDLSPETALNVAGVEAQAGMSSVFHFLLTSETYNLMSREGQAILKALRERGARVGLHVDPAAFVGEDSIEHRHMWLRALLDLAQLVLGPVDSYSVHRPARLGWGPTLSPAGLPFAVPPFAADYYDNAGLVYRSDSRRQWMNGCMCREIEAFRGAPLQLNTHPEWWTEAQETREGILNAYLAEHVRKADQYLAANLSFYRPAEEPPGQAPAR